MIAAQESMTAKLCSFARAYHSMLGKNKIFDDYLAYDIIGKDVYDEIGSLLKGQVEATGQLPRYGFELARVRGDGPLFLAHCLVTDCLCRAGTGPVRT